VPITFEWRGEFDNAEVNALHAEAFETRVYDESEWDWHELVHRHSLGWVVARDGTRLVGFVNVPWDGLVHAWIQDTMVAVDARHRSVGTRLVAAAREQARRAGCEWLHVDFDDDLRDFYLDACGFTPVPAGVIALQDTVVIRDAVPDDLPDVRRVFRQASLTNDDDRDALLAHPEVLELSDASIREGRTRVAVAGERIVGFSTVLASDDVVELDDLFVDPARMGQGVGRRLVADVVATARDGGAGRVEVTANPQALEFYERVGFVADAEVETRFGPAVRMHLDVGGAG
jgi:GNAT superfamily N-acetyltransferase